MVSAQVGEPPSDVPRRMQAAGPNLLWNKHVVERVTVTLILFAGTEGRRAMAVRVLCCWPLGCEYHLEVFERCRRGPSQMDRVEILRMSVVYFPTLLILDHYQPIDPEKTSASLKHILPYVERHRHTVLVRRTRLG